MEFNIINLADKRIMFIVMISVDFLLSVYAFGSSVAEIEPIIQLRPAAKRCIFYPKPKPLRESCMGEAFCESNRIIQTYFLENNLKIRIPRRLDLLQNQKSLSGLNNTSASFLYHIRNWEFSDNTGSLSRVAGQSGNGSGPKRVSFSGKSQPGIYPGAINELWSRNPSCRS